MRKALRVLGIFCAIGFFAWMVYDFAFHGPEAKRAMEALEGEASVVRPPHSATETRHSATHKPHSALVTSTYSTAMSYPELRSYYDVELAAHGWTFIREQSDRAWGNDLGGFSAYYRKGVYTATLQFAGVKANYGWTYAVGLGWGS